MNHFGTSSHLTLFSVGNVNMVNYLLNEIGIEPKDILFNDGSNLVHTAVRFNQLDVLYLLLTHRHGAYRYLVSYLIIITHLNKVNTPDNNGNTPLHVIIANTAYDVHTKITLAKAIIQAGAELRLQNNDRKTPIELLSNELEKGMILHELESDLAVNSQNCIIS